MGLLSFLGFSQDSIFDEKISVFNELGYELNEGVDKEFIFNKLDRNFEGLKQFKEDLKKAPYSTIYYLLGQQFVNNSKVIQVSKNCIMWDLEFIDSPQSYIQFMKIIESITKGDFEFSEMKITVDNENYQWLEFKVNGVSKNWKLQKVRYISDSFFYRFSTLTKEFNTNRKFTIYDNNSQAFVIDYATETEQAEFRKKTGLKRMWLGETRHFTVPKN